MGRRRLGDEVDVIVVQIRHVCRIRDSKDRGFDDATNDKLSIARLADGESVKACNIIGDIKLKSSGSIACTSTCCRGRGNSARGRRRCAGGWGNCQSRTDRC